LILGALTVLLPVVLAVPAILLGVLALRDIRRQRPRRYGGGYAFTGIIAGLVGNLSLFYYLSLYEGVRERQDRQLSATKLQKLVFAMHAYHEKHKRLPSHAIYSKDGKPLLSWRVTLLPALGEHALYDRFKLNEPWDSPHNRRLLELMPNVYAHPRGKIPEAGWTHYQVFIGQETSFLPHPDRGARLGSSFPNGTSTSILIAEAAEAVPWTKPADLDYSPTSPLPLLGGIWRNAFCVAMADGSTCVVNDRVSEKTLRAAIEPGNGFLLGEDWVD
jgi:hypothetical protein